MLCNEGVKAQFGYRTFKKVEVYETKPINVAQDTHDRCLKFQRGFTHRLSLYFVLQLATSEQMVTKVTRKLTRNLYTVLNYFF